MLEKLISRTAVAVALAGFLAMGTSTAEAKTHVDLWLGIPGFPYWNGPGYYGNVYRDRLSCSHGRWIVDHADTIRFAPPIVRHGIITIGPAKTASGTAFVWIPGQAAS
jgi:hypothetical protein